MQTRPSFSCRGAIRRARSVANGEAEYLVTAASAAVQEDDLPGGRKFALYAQAGVTHYWIIDPNSMQLRVFTLDTAGAYVETGSYRGAETYEPPLFPGLSLRPVDWEQAS